MVDLTTRYMGLQLKNPLVPSSGPMSRHLDSARRLEDAGAAALVMNSLFAETVEHDRVSVRPRGVNDRPSSAVDTYLEHLAALKAGLEIPVIASLNGTTLGDWTDRARDLQEAGADGLELNVYHIPASLRESSAEVEDLYIEILETVRARVEIPLAVKLSSQFTAPVHLAGRLAAAGADALALFNRFYQPDIDLETLEVVPRLALSTSEESLLRIRWLAILHGRVDCSLAITGGVHNVRDVAKSLLAGADVVHMCSALLRRGPGHLAVILQALEQWLEEKGYASVEQLRGSLSQRGATDSAAFLRANYIRVLETYGEGRAH
jgi:dihydroorotate dehydrogenase (fumarate)